MKKIKIGLLTFHSVTNYGALLQAYGLQETLRSLNADSEFINYRFDIIKKEKKRMKIYKSPLKVMKNFIKNNLIKLKSKEIMFNEFSNEYLNISKDEYKYFEKLSLLEEKYDKFIVGSDQVWNQKISENDPTFLFNFIKDKSKCYSYAASMGGVDADSNFKSIMEHNLRDFNSISVRENKAKNFISSFYKNNIEVNLDPTLLLSKNNWEKIAKLPLKKNYVLIYTLHPSENVYKLADELSRKDNIEIIEIATGLKRRKNVTYIKGIGPSEFLGLFINSKYVLTNSFHGTIFSIIMKKLFYVDLLKTSKKWVNTRMTELLNLIGQSSRYKSDMTLEEFLIPVDFSKISNILDIERKKAISFLNSICNNSDN